MLNAKLITATLFVKHASNFYAPLPGLFKFALIPGSIGHNMGVGIGSESDPSAGNFKLKQSISK